LFLGFLSIGARAFGGLLPWAHRVLVEERRWLSAEDFAQVLALCQLLPGPNIANCSVVLGRRWFGLSGAVTAFLGLFALPFVWVLHRRFDKGAPASPTVLLRQGLLVGLYISLCTWLQINRALGLSLALVLALGLGLIEGLIHLTERSRWRPGR